MKIAVNNSKMLILVLQLVVSMEIEDYLKFVKSS